MAEKNTPDPKDQGQPPPRSPNAPVEGRVIERAQISKDIKLPDVEPRQRRISTHQFPRQPTKTKNPRKVRGGVKVSSTERASSSWAGLRFLRLMELAAGGTAQADGLEYARLGQVRRIDIGAGRVSALVQGRLPKAYRTNLEIPAFSREKWDRIVEAMIDQALYSAKLLAGEVPPSIEDVFAPLGLRLFPAESGENASTEVVPTCTCDEFSDASPWCKHACCVAYAIADQLAEDPWIVFRLRGMEKDELLERLRHHRSLSSAVGGAVPVYVPKVPAVEDVPVPPLDQCAERFWEAPPGAARALRELDLAPEAPELTHPLLRRLGTSPFERATFPIVGLFATCYDLVTRDTAAEIPPDPNELNPNEPDAIEQDPSEHDPRQEQTPASTNETPNHPPAAGGPPAPETPPELSPAERRRRALAPKKIGKAKARKPD